MTLAVVTWLVVGIWVVGDVVWIGDGETPLTPYVAWVVVVVVVVVFWTVPGICVVVPAKNVFASTLVAGNIWVAPW
jgi:purine-cytosine permease-like protein